MQTSPLSPVFLGADVSKATIDLALALPSSGKRTRALRLSISNDAAGFAQFEPWIQQHHLSHPSVCLEATGTYSDAFALFLHEHGYSVSVINPARVHAFRTSEGITSKTDAIDAWLLSRFGQEKQPRSWQPTPPALQELRQLLARQQDIHQMLQQERNRLENGRLPQSVRQEIVAHLDFLQAQVEKIDAQLKMSVRASQELEEQCRLLTSIPGIGELSAIRLIAFFGPGTTFSSARQMAAYVGVHPCEHRSGTSVHGQTHIVRHGHAQLRHWLYLCALTSQYRDPDMKQWGQALEARGKCKKVVILAVMRKMVHIVYGVLTSQCPYDAKRAWPEHDHRQEQDPQAA